MRGESRQGRLTAPRGASMLEMGKYGDEAAGAGSGNCSDVRVARVAASERWICHRDIVNLKTKRRLSRRHSSSAARRRCHDSIRAALPTWSAGRFLGFRLQSPRADARRGIESGKRSDESTTRPGLFAQPAGHRTMVPAKRLAQPMSEPAARTRSEFVTHHK
jgi:hypothetical protein